MGKLPVTFYKSTQQLPDFEDYSMKNRTYRYFEDALYPFGYGLSYTSFEIGTAKLQTLTNNSITLQIPVTNTGKREGTELVQVYLRRDDDIEGPSKTLRSFAHITLKAGETKKAILKLNRNQFECWDASTNTMRVIPGKYTIFYGNSSKKEDLKQIHYTLN